MCLKEYLTGNSKPLYDSTGPIERKIPPPKEFFYCANRNYKSKAQEKGKVSDGSKKVNSIKLEMWGVLRRFHHVPRDDI